MAPLFALIYIYGPFLGADLSLIALGLLILLIFSELSDILDGLLARKWNQVTLLGKILDPMSDSIMRLSCLFVFTQGVIALPLIGVLLLFYREILIGGLRTMCALHGIALAARPSGKVKAVLQALMLFLVTILLLLYGKSIISLTLLHKITTGALILITIYSWISAVEYFWAYRHQLKKDFESS